MNSRLKNNKFVRLIAVAAVVLLSFSAAQAQSECDDFGIWTSLNASKKLTDRLKIGFEGELRSIEGVSQMDRRSIGVDFSYDILSWLKADIGYIYIQSHNSEEKKIKDFVGLDNDNNEIYSYNIDRSYWEQRDRLVASLSASWKIGRVKFSLRERVQYQYTHSALVYEDQYRPFQKDSDDPNSEYITNDDPNDPYKPTKSEAELKDAKQNTTLRTRLTAKWDIKKCPVTPFASVELFTRLDKWKFHDKLRYRIGAEYKIDKDNEISLYYLYQDNHASSSPAIHAIGVGYSFDL